MILDRDLVKQAWERCGATCECKRIGCQHPGGRCNSPLEEKLFNDEEEEGGWFVRLINEFGPAKLFNVEVVCPTCFNKLKAVSGDSDKPKPISSKRSDTLNL